MIHKCIFLQIYLYISFSAIAFCTKQPGSGKTIKGNATVIKKSTKPTKYFGPMPPDFVAFCSVNGIETYCDWLESLEGDIDKCKSPENLEKNANYRSKDFCEQEMMPYFVELNRGMWLFNVHPQSKSYEEHFIFTICCLPEAIPPFRLLPIEEPKMVKCYSDPKMYDPWLLSTSWCGAFVSNDPKDFEVQKTKDNKKIKKLCCVKPGNGICISTDCDFYEKQNAYYSDKTLIDLAAKKYCTEPLVFSAGEGESYKCEGKYENYEYEPYEFQFCLVNSEDTGKNRIWKLENYNMKCEEKEEYYWCQLNKKNNNIAPIEYEHVSSTICDETYEFITCCAPGWFPTHMLPLDANEINKDYDPKTFLPWIVKKHVRAKEP